MPGANLTRIEAEERKSIIAAPIHYTVKLDLTRGAKDFGSETTITFDAKPGESSFLDLIANEVSEITLNGETLDPAEAYVDSRIELKNLKEHNEVTVKAMCQYSNTGEGLHRSVDPSDGNVYLYTQFEVPDARRVYAVFDQPDLKAVFDFSVLAAKSWIVTSNMPTASVTDNETVTEEGTLGDHAAETTKLWVFEPTPTMSSYLTAICAGPYAEWHTEYANEDGRTVPMAMYCRQALAKAFSKDVDYLFDITKKASPSTPRPGACRTRTPSSTRSTCRSTTPAPWRTSAWSPSATSTCSNPRSPTPTRNAVWSPCCTSSPTCGSATT